MKQNILFIIFPGNMTTSKHFKLNYVGTTPPKGYSDNSKILNNSNFIPELKKLGQVHFVEPSYYNLPYYHSLFIESKEQYLYKKNINFSIDDLNIQKYCDNVYSQFKDFKGKFVLIGHSRGAKWVYTFSQKYYKKCLLNFIIDGTTLYPDAIIKGQERDKINFKKTFNKNLKDITNNDIQLLIKKVKEYDDEANSKLNDYIHTYISLQFPKNVKKLNVKTISFKNLYIKTTHGIYNKREFSQDKIIKIVDEEEYFLKNNPDNYRTIYFVNKTHFPHAHPDSRELILNTIKSYLK